MKDGRLKLNQALPWQKQHSSRRRLFTSQLDLNLRNELLQLENSFVWCWNWTRLSVDQKYLESVQRWCWRRMEKIS